MHAWDARWKVGSLAVLVVVLVTTKSLVVAALGALAALGLVVAARLPARLVLSRMVAAQAILLPCLLILPFAFGGEPVVFGPLKLSREGLRWAGLLYLRALAIVTLGLAVVYSTPMVVLLRALQAFRVPRVLVEIALLTYRYLFTLVWEWTRMRWALATRGFLPRATTRSQRTLANVVGVSLVRSVERTERIQFAMRCRGFQGRLRTLHEFHSRPADALKALACLAIAAVLCLLDHRWPPFPA